MQPQLKESIGPLIPISGQAWPRPIIYMSWLFLLVIGVKLVHTASTNITNEVNPTVSLSIIFLFASLVVMAYFMHRSTTTINEQGIQQSWISKRQISWHEIQSARFVPLFASKKLVCFTGRGRPVIFHGGTPELQAAFAHIELAYKRKL